MKNLIEYEFKSKFQNKKLKVKFKTDLTVKEFFDFSEIAAKFQNIRAINFMLKNKDKLSSGMKNMSDNFNAEDKSKFENFTNVINEMDLSPSELAEAIEFDSYKIAKDNFFVDLQIVQFMIDLDSIKLQIEKDLLENNDFWFGISRKDICQLAENFRVSILQN